MDMWPILNNPPVGVALAQVKLNTESFSIQKVDVVDRQIKDFLPIRKEGTQVNIGLGKSNLPLGVSKISATSDVKIATYIYFSKEQKTKLEISGDTITYVSEDQYQGWDVFKGNVLEFLGILERVFSQSEIQRTSIRFINRFSFPDFDLEGKRVILVTTHRRENLGEPMRQVYKALKALVEEFADVEIIFPVHKNPRVREVVNDELGGLERVRLIDPLDYEPFANLMNRATLILTDSGGVQEEAPALGKPVLVLRDTTERPEALTAGTVKLIGTNREKVYGAAKILLTDAAAYKKMAEARSPYGDGHAAERIVKALLWRHKFLNECPAEFISRNLDSCQHIQSARRRCSTR